MCDVQVSLARCQCQMFVISGAPAVKPHKLQMCPATTAEIKVTRSEVWHSVRTYGLSLKKINICLKVSLLVTSTHHILGKVNTRTVRNYR